MKIVDKVIGNGTISFDHKDQRRKINLYYLGQENCNEVVDNNIVPISHENIKQVMDSHYNISSNYFIEVEADLTEDGRLINFKIK